MDVVVKARHCNLSDQFRSYVEEKITRLEKLDDRVIRVEVEVSAEKNKRQHDQASRVEITVRTKGPVVRAEAAATPPPEAPDAPSGEGDTKHSVAGIEVDGDGPLVVREKVHQAAPMSLDQALLELELVGHDFYLFIDAESNCPSVVYRRRAYDYGVIRLETAEELVAVGD